MRAFCFEVCVFDAGPVERLMQGFSPLERGIIRAACDPEQIDQLVGLVPIGRQRRERLAVRAAAIPALMMPT